MKIQRLLFAALFPMLFGAPARAQGVFAGRWTVVEAKAAPWVDASAQNHPDFDPAFQHAQIVFLKSRVEGPAPLGCAKVQYTLSKVVREDLFQGALTDPARQAAALGFKSGRIVSLNLGCLRSDADLEMDFADARPLRRPPKRKFPKRLAEFHFRSPAKLIVRRPAGNCHPEESCMRGTRKDLCSCVV
jgi:hypothetical protein